MPEGLAQPHPIKGRLKRVLEHWCCRIRAITSTPEPATADPGIRVPVGGIAPSSVSVTGHDADPKT